MLGVISEWKEGERVKQDLCLHTLCPAHSCPHLSINTMTPLLFKCILCCLFPYQHIDSTGNAEYILVGIHIYIHPGCFDSHAGTYGFHHIHPHLCNWERSRTWKNTQLHTLPNMFLTLIITIETLVFVTEEYCCKTKAPFRLVFWKAWKSINVIFFLSISNLTGAFEPLHYSDLENKYYSW